MERTRTFSAFFKLIFEFIRKHSVSSRTPSQKNNDKMAIKMHIHSLLNHFVRGAESAGKMIKFAQTGKFFRKLPHLGEQQNTSLRRDTPKISPETENFSKRAFAHTGRFCTSETTYLLKNSILTMLVIRWKEIETRSKYDNYLYVFILRL